MPVLTSFDDLAALLARDHTKHVLDRAQQVIELPTKDPGLPGNVQLRWDRRAPFVHLIRTVLPEIPAERVVEIERAIVRLNHRIELPGFGLDEDTRRLYYRVVVPAFPPGVDAEVLYRLVEGTVKTAMLHRPAFEAIASGQTSEVPR